MGQPLETVRIAWDNDLGYLTINKDDLTDEHTLWSDAEPDQPVTDARPTRDEREADLQEANWQELKSLAAALPEPITEKPESGWDEVIPLVLEAEYGTES